VHAVLHAVTAATGAVGGCRSESAYETNGRGCGRSVGNAGQIHEPTRWNRLLTENATAQQARIRPSSPGEFHPEALTEPCLTVSGHTARAIHGELPPSCRERSVPPVAG